MFEGFVKEAKLLQEKYKAKVSLIVGMETDVIREDSFEIIRRLKKEFQLDYIVGSVHHIDGIPIDCSLEQFEEAERLVGGTEKVICKYFDDQLKLLQEVKPEVIGHFDLIRLHRPEFEITDLIWEKVVRNINFGISYGALFEINTSGASPNKKLQFPYPHRKILKVWFYTVSLFWYKLKFWLQKQEFETSLLLITVIKTLKTSQRFDDFGIMLVEIMIKKTLNHYKK